MNKHYNCVKDYIIILSYISGRKNDIIKWHFVRYLQREMKEWTKDKIIILFLVLFLYYYAFSLNTIQSYHIIFLC